MTQAAIPMSGRPIRFAALNSAHHRIALNIYMVIVLAHWAEHLAQAFQIWASACPARRRWARSAWPFPG
ncbi:hypothetical protein ACFQX7_28800 [Luedemannella flava]